MHLYYGTVRLHRLLSPNSPSLPPGLCTLQVGLDTLASSCSVLIITTLVFAGVEKVALFYLCTYIFSSFCTLGTNHLNSDCRLSISEIRARLQVFLLFYGFMQRFNFSSISPANVAV